jgi:hypothetical protein
MASSPVRLTPARVLQTVAALQRRPQPIRHEPPPCTWCQGPTVWTTGNKTRCTRCGYIPS